MANKIKNRLKKNQTRLIPIGWREWIIFPEYSGFAIKAKIDTGARTSALHATHIKEFQRDNQKWVKFRIHQSTESLGIESPVLGYKEITNSFGNKEVRPVIKLKIKLGRRLWKTDMTLARRNKLAHPMLIGRKSLKKQHTVYPHKSFLAGTPKIN